MTISVIPVVVGAQTFSISLAGVTYNMRLIWDNQPDGGYVLDIADASGNSLVAGLALTTGVDLLSQFPDLNFGGALYVLTDGNALATPGYNDLGSPARLHFVTP